MQKTSVLVFFSLAIAYGAQASSPPPPKRGISQKAAHALVEEIVKSRYPDATVEPSGSAASQHGLDADFIGFSALAANPGGGARVDSYAVNRWTGDVWEMQGSVCTLVVGKRLSVLQKQTRRIFGAGANIDLHYRSLKPTECDP